MSTDVHWSNFNHDTKSLTVGVPVDTPLAPIPTSINLELPNNRVHRINNGTMNASDDVAICGQLTSSPETKSPSPSCLPHRREGFLIAAPLNGP